MESTVLGIYVCPSAMVEWTREEIDWALAIPKTELHAHLNGSIRDSTLLELTRVLYEKGAVDFPKVEHVIQTGDRSLVDAFQLFDLIHKVTTDHEALSRITKEVIEDFSADNVIYLELRTTPKRNDSKGISKISYMDAVMKGVKAVTSVDVILPSSVSDKEWCTDDDPTALPTSKKRIFVSFLLSIDRREGEEDALETVKLAAEMKDRGVVGIDLSGNPTVGNWETFLPALEYARQQSLFITLHCGEVPNRREIQQMLDFGPDRIGHACFFEEDDWKKLKSLRIPVEICLTSNIYTSSVQSIEAHHFGDLYSARHPLVLCTDDKWVLSTTLSGEYVYAASSFGLGKNEMLLLARRSVQYTFADDAVKAQLEEIFALADPSFIAS